MVKTIEKLETLNEYTKEKRVSKCKRCHGRGHEGQYLLIGSENVEDKELYHTCTCVKNVDYKRERQKFIEKTLKSIKEKQEKEKKVEKETNNI